MKKIFATLLTAVIVLGSFTGCSSPLKDGIYRAEMAEESYGWTDYVIITVSGNKITAVEFDSFDEDGDKKSEDEDYRASMEPVSGTYPAKFLPEIAQQLIDTQDIKKVETVAGATSSTNSFILLVSALQENMENGITETVVVTTSE